MQNKRAIKGAVVEPSAQLRMLVPFALLLGVHIGTVLWLNFTSQKLFMQLDQRQNDELTAAIMIISNFLVKTSVGSMVIFMALMLFLWVRCSHRVFGPVVAINRQLDRLLAGEAGGEIQLRKADELKLTAAKINQLTQKLSGTLN